MPHDQIGASNQGTEAASEAVKHRNGLGTEWGRAGHFQ